MVKSPVVENVCVHKLVRMMCMADVISSLVMVPKGRTVTMVVQIYIVIDEVR